MDIREALEAALAEAEAAIPAAQAEAEEASRRVAGLLDEVRGLQLALARRTALSGVRTTTKTFGVDAALVAPPAEPAASEAASAEPGGDWALLNHMDAVLRALTDAKRPLSPKDIVRALRVVGRPDTNDQVRAALAALKKRGRVSLKGRAQWVPTSEPRVPGLQEAQAYQPTAFTLPRSESNGLASIPTDESEPAKV